MASYNVSSASACKHDQDRDTGHESKASSVQEQCTATHVQVHSDGMCGSSSVQILSDGPKPYVVDARHATRAVRNSMVTDGK